MAMERAADRPDGAVVVGLGRPSPDRKRRGTPRGGPIPVIERPRFRRHLRVEVVPPDLVLFVGETGFTYLEGRLLPLVAPQIDGVRTAREIMDRLVGRANPVEVGFGLELLEEHGVLEPAERGPGDAEADASGSPDEASLEILARHLGVAPPAARELPRRKAVGVTPVGDIDSGPLRTILEGLGIEVVEGVENGGDLELVVAGDYLDEGIAAFFRRGLEDPRPWLLLRPRAPRPWIGPVVHPADGACWACLEARLRQNRPVEEFLRIHRAKAGAEAASAVEGPLTLHGPDATPWPIARWACHAAALLALRWLTSSDAGELGRALWTLDPSTLEVERHVVVRLPGCPACGRRGGGEAPRVEPPAPPRLARRARLPQSDGGYRAVPPEETLRRYGHLVSPITGVVGALERRPVDPRAPVQVFTADFASPPDAVRRGALATGLRRKSAGKGVGEAQARASALGEALEHYSLIHHGDEPRRRARLADLGEAGIHPNRCMLFSDRQLEERELWNARGLRPLRVVEPFDEERELDWSPLWSLTEERFKYLPLAYCAYGFAEHGEDRFCLADSNGNAAGNSLEEAILQGFFELVERDAVALWWHGRARRPAIAADRFAQPYREELGAYYRSLGRELHVLDLTTDLGVPVAAAVSRAVGSGAGDLLLGFGAHVRPEIAVNRALTEMNQFLPALLSGSLRPLLSGELEATGFLEPDPGAVATPVRASAGAGGDLLDEVRDCVERAAALGLETLVLDQTRPEIGLSVVKVVVPGLRHFWPRFAPGRLFDVPVRLGWSDRPRREEELNPVHLLV